MIKIHVNMEELNQHLEFIKKMYQMVRIVEPSEKKVFALEGDLSTYKDGFCYSFWETGNYCENCISYRASIEEEIVYKVEYAPDKIYMVTAMPVKIDEKVVVIEMLKEITDTMVIDTLGNRDKEAMKDYILNINNKIVKDELTGIFNRRFMNERLPVEIIQSKIHKRPMSIIMTDIDRFREINNT
ncbi:MAG: diguanylate cyclase, partial [Clostridiales bacterium]|nr:diguanylate cyclase [Clostridiales bacterium]